MAAGQVTRSALRSRRYRRLFPDVYVAADVAVDLVVRSLAAAVLVGEGGVLGGHSAAAVLGAPCGAPDAPAEVIVPRRLRPRPDLLARHEEVPPAERLDVAGTAVTSPVRTALDLACRDSLVEAVVAVDALARRFGFPPSDVVRCAYDHLGRRGMRRLPLVVRLADPDAESPLQTRIRLAILLAGLPPPQVQHAEGPYRIALAYPEHRVAIDVDEPGDRVRDAHLAMAGWHRILRFDEATVRHEPELVPLTVRRMLGAAATWSAPVPGLGDPDVVEP